MRVLIVDDEKLARDRLRELLNDIGGYTVVGEAMNGTEAVEKSAELNPDVLLMDIRMPGMDGLEAAMHLMGMENPPAVIFTTAYDQHALDAFDVNAVDYLLKPIRKDRLAKALSKAHKLTIKQIPEINQARPEPAMRTTQLPQQTIKSERSRKSKRCIGTKRAAFTPSSPMPISITISGAA